MNVFASRLIIFDILGIVVIFLQALPFLNMGSGSTKPLLLQRILCLNPTTLGLDAGNKPSAVHAEVLPLNGTSTQPKWHLSSKASDGNTALALFDNPDDLHETLSSKEQRALQSKNNLTILP
ncbi:hypothetical protein BKA64DRAFT_377345 [Cadophora sp. MPI-SDFR-AT-0126]|nr:hypothetical protein BKA64DRAFT_377345 [Leotiomycetes sp. MPI-SDFR-AT-0126]